MPTRILALNRFQPGRFLDRLNREWHDPAMKVYLVIVLSHWAEHVVQALQIYVFGLPPAKALGVLGFIWPVLIRSEWLHYVYALLMLIGFLILRPAMQGKALFWWNCALGIQIWHHFEHLLLLGQAATNHPLFGASVPTSLVQLIIPRVELHLIYNGLVTVPMAIAMYWHLYPPVSERHAIACSCSRHRIA